MVVDPVEVLQRWEIAGGWWRVIGHSDHEVTVGLFRCDGGEQVDVLRSADAALRAYIGGRRTNLD
ncbi:hypothetical protein [Mycobacterium sp. MAA66]|uniref:hypothetical protein n=1 Tax=Mycobacterium sp. MAA66 TaxID=3156297 RepID=UPI0035124536